MTYLLVVATVATVATRLKTLARKAVQSMREGWHEYCSRARPHARTPATLSGGLKKRSLGRYSRYAWQLAIEPEREHNRRMKNILVGIIPSRALPPGALLVARERKPVERGDHRQRSCGIPLLAAPQSPCWKSPGRAPLMVDARPGEHVCRESCSWYPVCWCGIMETKPT